MVEILIPVILVICILFGVWFWRLTKSLDTEAKKRFGAKIIPYRCDLEDEDQ